MGSKIVVVQGLQFGSEGKGAVAGVIGHVWQPDTVVCANHPNAGHTYNDPEGRKYVHRALPVAAACPSVKNVLIGPGAVVDINAVLTERYQMDTHGVWPTGAKRIIIHPNASILLPQHAQDEQSLVRIGSTMKGSMESVIGKMRRDPSGIMKSAAFPLEALALGIYVDADLYDSVINYSHKILVEGAQGYSLGIHEQFYPYCTSRDVSTAQVLADCRIPIPRHRDDLHVVGVARTYPIRVANRFDAEGKQVGTSGPHYDDQRELDWGIDLRREPELTTVTRLPRRVFTFSTKQIRDACRVMSVNSIALTFCDYLLPVEVPEGEGDGPIVGCVTPVRDFALSIEDAVNLPVRLLGYGPAFRDLRQTDAHYNLYDPNMRFL